MSQELWGEIVSVDKTPAPHSCVFSDEPIARGEHAVSILVDDTRLTKWVALEAVDDLVETLRTASAGDGDTEAPENVRLAKTMTYSSLISCGLCSRSNSGSRLWLTLGGGDQITSLSVCDECFDDLADALERVWECGDEFVHDVV